MPRYNPAVVEPKWQQFWEENKTFACPRLPKGRKLYVLDMFPYPSGDGLHVGHPEGYTATDIVCRQSRMRGVSVMHPMGWDAFGLPAEQHAKKTGTHPRATTEKNVATFRRQLKMLGFSYDWDREVATTDVDYFRWTQWIFLVLFDTWFDEAQQRGRPIAELSIPDEVSAEGPAAVARYRDEHRLAYQLEAPVNWCPALGTVLANEEVIDGHSERGGHPVMRLPLRQWMLRITAYADRLEKDLDRLDWSEGIKLLQRNWIGRSTGAEVDFYIGDEGRGTGETSGQWSVASGQRRENGEGGREKGEERGLGTSVPSSTAYQLWKQSRTADGFPKKPGPDALRVYTTRPDTLFGATYMVIAPEHPLVERLTSPEQSAAVKTYCAAASRKSDMDRTDLAKEKTGVWTGSYAINPVNDEPIPIWVADYVLAGYGTGAIMAVPAHDTRDFEFAKQFNLPIIAVVDPEGSGGNSQRLTASGNEKGEGGREKGEGSKRNLPSPACGRGAGGEGSQPISQSALNLTLSGHHEVVVERGQNSNFPIPEPPNPESPSSAFIADGTAINSGPYNGLTTAEFKQRIAADLSAQGVGRSAVNYKLRDWLFSRQHFWGEPFPILHELDDAGQPTGAIRALEPDELPLDLPAAMTFDAAHDRPEPPLDKAPDDWLYVVRDGKRYKRETNTMPQWAGSCWYYLRFLDPRNNKAAVDPEVERAWMPVDLYVGGAEHAVLHLLYARFWHKVLFDRGYLSGDEPFQKLVNQGMILGENGEKMSKSRGNVVNPDQIVSEYGADSLRLYEMFMGPLEAVKPWSMDGVSGVRGFLDRAWRMILDERAEDVRLHPSVNDSPMTDEQDRMLNRTIKAVTADIAALSFNTAIARMMEFVNFFLKQDSRPRAAMERFVLLLSPFAPHIAEELWAALGHSQSLAYHPWPTFDEAKLKESTIEVPVQICGKLRGRIEVPADCDAAALEAAARSEPKIAELLAGRTVVKAVVVPGRMVNFVVK